MTSYYSSASFVKMYDINNNVVRIIDLIKSPYVDGLKDPYFFSYYFLTQGTQTGYNLPAEGLNHTEVLDTLERALPGSSRDELLYFSNLFLPQLHPVQDDLNSIGSILPVIKGEELYTNVYVTAYPGEVKMEFYEPSTDPEDPYGILNPEALNLVHEPIELGDKLKLRLVVLGIDIRPSVWEYVDPVVDNTSRPVQSLFGTLENSSDYSRLPKGDISSMFPNNSTIPYPSSLLLRDRFIMGAPTAVVKDLSHNVSQSNLQTNDPF